MPEDYHYVCIEDVINRIHDSEGIKYPISGGKYQHLFDKYSQENTTYCQPHSYSIDSNNKFN